MVRSDRWKSARLHSHNFTRHQERSIEFTRLSRCVRPQKREKNCFFGESECVWKRENGNELVGKFSEFSTRFSSKNARNSNEIFSAYCVESIQYTESGSVFSCGALTKQQHHHQHTTTAEKKRSINACNTSNTSKKKRRKEEKKVENLKSLKLWKHDDDGGFILCSLLD